MARYPLICEISAWDISDSVAGVIIARLLAGIGFPDIYTISSGSAGADMARRLAARLDRSDPARIWKKTDPKNRPDLAELLASENMFCIIAS